MPVITVVDLPLPRSIAPQSLNFRTVDWPDINNKLKHKLSVESPAVHIRTKEEFITKVDAVMQIITKVLEANLKTNKLSPYLKRWWMKELTDL
jgi:hypothetical protein